MPQADLFSAPAGGPETALERAAASGREYRPAAPTLAWARLLARSTTGHRTTLHVSLLWTGVVRETLQDPELGRVLLFKDGHTETITPDSAAPGRVVFIDPRTALEIHARTPLVPLGGGTHAARYRYAEPGEPFPAELPLPPAIEAGE